MNTAAQTENSIKTDAYILPARCLSAILKARDLEQLRDHMQRVLATLGVCDFLSRMDINSSNSPAVCHLFGTLPAPTMGLFSSYAEAQTDPISRHLAKSNRPLAWQTKQLCILNAGQVYAQLKATGIRHGLSMAVRSEQAVSRVDFYSDAIACPFPATQQANLLLLGTYLHEATEILWRKSSPQQTPLLSDREIECLEWSSRGKTSQEIGRLLGITQHTVYFHLKNAAAKLGVHGSRHAVSRAIVTGILCPVFDTSPTRTQQP